MKCDCASKSCSDCTCEKLWKEIYLFILNKVQDNEEDKNSKDLKNTVFESILKQDGGSILQSPRETCRVQRLRLRPHNGSITTVGRRVGILGKPHLDLTVVFFVSFRCFFSLGGK